jgi:hypothetical protein
MIQYVYDDHFIPMPSEWFSRVAALNEPGIQV